MYYMHQKGYQLLLSVGEMKQSKKYEVIIYLAD